jgi:hypothetical protein
VQGKAAMIGDVLAPEALRSSPIIAALPCTFAFTR